MMYSNVGHGTTISGTAVMAAPRDALRDDFAVVWQCLAENVYLRWVEVMRMLGKPILGPKPWEVWKFSKAR